MTTAAAIVAFAALEGFTAIANIDGASAIIFIPSTTPVLYADGSVAFYEDGVEAVEVSSVSAALDALGY